MMSKEENEKFTSVGKGTPMGELLRRYWHPVGAVSEFETVSVKPVEVLCEHLVLYKDKRGVFGLVDRQCPHRRADMAYGIVEECGLRCSYHGWQFSEDGSCKEQPYEDIANPKAKFKDKVRIKSYPLEVKSGMIFAYMGPLPAPLLPNWEPLTWDNGFQQIVFGEIPCNWFQCQENSCDPVHFEWMHRNWAGKLKDKNTDYGPKHLELAFEEFEYGHLYKRIREDTDHNSDHWTVGSVALFPNAFFLGDHIEWRVPVNDEKTLSVTWSIVPVPADKRPYTQSVIPSWNGAVKDEETGKWITSHVMNQDFVGWVGQGTIADRTQEHLGRSDKGILMMRKTFRENMKLVEQGADPKGTIRTSELNTCIDLPIKNRELYTASLNLDDMRALAKRLAYRMYTPEYEFQAGMPADVRKQYHDAIGYTDPDKDAG